MTQDLFVFIYALVAISLSQLGHFTREECYKLLTRIIHHSDIPQIEFEALSGIIYFIIDENRKYEG